MGKEQLSFEDVQQMGLGFQASKTLLSAIEFGIFTQLAEGGADTATLANRVGIHHRGAADFFDTLVALGLLRRVDGVYHNTDVAATYLVRSSPSYPYLGSLLEMANSRLYDIWGDLSEALRTGLPQNEIKSSELPKYEAIYEDRERLKQFLASMTGVSHAANVEIARQYPWEEHSTFVDLGTAQGDLAVQVALRHPHLTGIGLDLPVVEPVFEEYVKKNRVDGRLRFAPADFFVDDFPAADAFIFGHILHNWDLAQKKLLLHKAWTALPPGGAVIVYESVIDDARSENVFGLLMSLNMLTATEGGFNFTAADCKDWMSEVGFSRTRAVHLTGPDSMVIGVK
ncbi:acetylserotonin O-methyltransferase [Spirillospora sp. NBC_00431]